MRVHEAIRVDEEVGGFGAKVEAGGQLGPGPEAREAKRKRGR